MEILTQKEYSFTLNDSACSITSILVAGGSASRMKGIDKLFADLAGQPVLVHALLAYQGCRSIDKIVVAARPDVVSDVQKLCEQYGISKLSAIVEGGATRSESVKNAVDAVDADCGYIAIADGARPLTSQQDIEATVEAAVRFGAAACAVRVTDTIKVTDTDKFIQSTPDRSALWAAQTPQIFKADRYRQALAAHYGEFTDDCAMMEADGVRVKLVEGSYTNIKITTPTDLVIAQAFLTEGIL